MADLVPCPGRSAMSWASGLLKRTRLISLILPVLAILMSAPTTRADVVTINFENGVPGTPIGSFYSAQGITFSNAQFMHSFGLFGSSNVSFIGTTGPTALNPIVITFTDVQSAVTLTAVDLSREGFLMRAYDASSNLLGFSGDMGGGSNRIPIIFSVTSLSGIKYVEIFQPLNTSGRPGVLFDNLVLNDPVVLSAVPEPASLLLLGTGLAGVGFSLKRRRDSRKVKGTP